MDELQYYFPRIFNHCSYPPDFLVKHTPLIHATTWDQAKCKDSTTLLYGTALILTLDRLVVGAIQGHLRSAVQKISKLHSKQNFSLVLIVGDVFGEGEDAENETTALLNGEFSITIPTYFTVGDVALPDKVIEKLQDNDEVCPNLIYLGRKGVFTTSEGIRIAYLGGCLISDSTDVTLGKYDPLFKESEAKSLYGAHSAHILITNQWPSHVTRLSKMIVPENVDSDKGVQAIANLSSTLRPWYHFSSSPAAMWEREPYNNYQDYNSLDEPVVTRFKSLAGAQGPTKEWMAAFSLDTSRAPKAELPGESPFLRQETQRKRPADAGDNQQSYSRYENGSHGHYSGRHRKKARVKDPNDCFMCLNKPGFKTHMVVSIGDDSLVTILRGPLPLPTTFPQLSSTGHVMIIPHYHAADEIAHGRRPNDEVASEFIEMNKFRIALSNMIGSKSDGKLGAVCWEVNRTGIRHHHWQLIAIQAEHVRKGLVDAAFKVSREKYNYPSFQNCEPDQQLEQRNDYFRVWTWSPTTDPVKMADHVGTNTDEDMGATKSMYFPLQSADQSFNIWFGREVVAGLLQLEQRVDWRTCLLANEHDEQSAEEQDAEGLKKDFEEFDFAMQ